MISLPVTFLQLGRGRVSAWLAVSSGAVVSLPLTADQAASLAGLERRSFTLSLDVAAETSEGADAGVVGLWPAEREVST